MGHIGPRPRWWLPFAMAGVLLVVAGATGYGLAQIVAVVASAPAPRATLPSATLAPTPPDTGPPPTIAPTATAVAASASPSPRIHVVRRGEFVSQIALLYGVTPEAILEANDIADPNYVEIGQQLFIPPAP
jgi:LysM repeat protein